MDVTSHNTERINFKTFMFLAIFPAFNKYAFIFIPDENINPMDNGKANKVQLAIVSKFVFPAHLTKLNQ